MRRLEILIRKTGQEQERRVVLGRFGSMVITVLLMLVAIAVIAAALVFGYLVMGLVLAVLLVAIVVATIRGAFLNIRR